VNDAGAVRKREKETGPYAVGTTVDEKKKRRKRGNKSKRRDAHSDAWCLGQDGIDVVVKRGKGKGSCSGKAGWKQRRMSRLRVAAPNNTRVITI
jgi:hypothetical protein